MFRLLLILSALAGVAAYLTKPSEAEVTAEVKSLLRDAIEQGELSDVNDPALAVLLLTCKSDPDACSDILLQTITLTYEDRSLYAAVTADGLGKQANCYAAYTKLFCPGGLSQQ